MLHVRGFDEKKEMRFLRYWGGGGDWNGNKSDDDRIASADYRQLINSKIVLVIRTIGDILIIDRCGGHCGACDREVV